MRWGQSGLTTEGPQQLDDLLRVPPGFARAGAVAEAVHFFADLHGQARRCCKPRRQQLQSAWPSALAVASEMPRSCPTSRLSSACPGRSYTSPGGTATPRFANEGGTPVGAAAR